MLFNRVNTNPLILMVKNQRFFCKHCESTFMAKTPIVDKECFISNDVKRSIVLNLCETKSMDLIAREHCVSPTSVARILRLTEDRRRKNYLPRILSIDEFKSVNTVDASMSVNLTDLEGGHIFDILVDRRQRYLFEYFNSYPLKVRKRVEYVTTDMYRPYIDLAKKVFPNANIVVDKFHIVQLLTRELNKLRINEMKKLNTRSKEYKILKRYWKIPLTKNWELNSIYFYKNRHFKNMTSSVDILDYMLGKLPNLKEAYDFYQNFLLSISNNDVAMLKDDVILKS
ncbi:ISL3 family transposase [Streptococcus thermophilus]